jgi:hypothetical protein
METTFEFISCWLAAALMPCQSVTVLRKPSIALFMHERFL